MTIKNDLQIIKSYFSITKEEYKNDKIKAKTEFNNITDFLCKDGLISEKTYNNAYLTSNKRNDILILCNSYKLKIA